MKPAIRRAAPRPEPQRPFCVLITAGDRRGMWGRFTTIEAAAEIAAKLRAHGMAATVESDNAVVA